MFCTSQLCSSHRLERLVLVTSPTPHLQPTPVYACWFLLAVCVIRSLKGPVFGQVWPSFVFWKVWQGFGVLDGPLVRGPLVPGAPLSSSRIPGSSYTCRILVIPGSPWSLLAAALSGLSSLRRKLPQQRGAASVRPTPAASEEANN